VSRDEALRLNPEYAIAFTNRGVTRRAKGDLEGAIADHSEALRLNPELVAAFYNRGLVRRDMGYLEGQSPTLNRRLALRQTTRMLGVCSTR
jgi:tetratricopeptide (TPR) repeat protein